MNKYDTNELMNCFKMTVDLEGIKKLEEYITNLEQENNQLKKLANNRYKYSSEMEGKYILEKAKKDQLRSWLEEEIKEEYRLHKEFLRIGVIKGETKLTSQFKRVLSKLNELEGGKNE